MLVGCAMKGVGHRPTAEGLHRAQNFRPLPWVKAETEMPPPFHPYSSRVRLRRANSPRRLTGSGWSPCEQHSAELIRDKAHYVGSSGVAAKSIDGRRRLLPGNDKRGSMAGHRKWLDHGSPRVAPNYEALRSAAGSANPRRDRTNSHLIPCERRCLRHRQNAGIRLFGQVRNARKTSQGTSH